jgi:AcrR family transcriptional regulator
VRVTATTAPGRPRDPDVDRRIARAALDVFADIGWAGFAMETVARRAGVGKASVYLRWHSKERLLTDAVAVRLAVIADVDTGTLHGDLVRLTTQLIELYAGEHGRAALRLALEAAAVPGVAERYEAMRSAQRATARAIVRRAAARGDLRPGTSVTLLLDLLVGGAMMHALGSPGPAVHPASQARRLAGFAVDAVAVR